MTQKKFFEKISFPKFLTRMAVIKSLFSGSLFILGLLGICLFTLDRKSSSTRLTSSQSNDIIAELSKNRTNGWTLFFFAMKGCGHCEKFSITWNVLVESLRVKNVDVRFEKHEWDASSSIDTSRELRQALKVLIFFIQKTALSQKYHFMRQVSAFPTVMLLRGGREVAMLRGLVRELRSVESADAWLLLHMRSSNASSNPLARIEPIKESLSR